MTLKIVSLNAWGGRLHEPLLRFLVQEDPDILCLQEVVHTLEPCSEWLTYRDHAVELPQRARLYDEVRSALPDHQGFFAPTARGPLFDRAEIVPSEFGLATFVRRSLPIIGTATAFVHGAFCEDGWGPHPRSRNAHGVRVFDYGERFPLTVVQMHGLRDVTGKGDTPARIAQADALAGLIGNIWPGKERLVVCGDFNVLPDSTTFDRLAGLGLRDLVTANGFTDTRTSHYAKAGRFADYMLVTPQVDVVSFEVVAAPEVSDHRALRIRLR